MSAIEQLETVAAQYVTQDEVLSRMDWLTSRRLAKLRNAGKLPFQRGKKDVFIYRVKDLDRAIGESMECQDDNATSNTADDGSEGSPAPTDTTNSGTTGELDEPAADRLAQTI